MELKDIGVKLSSLSAQRDLLKSQKKDAKKLLSDLKKELINEKKAHVLVTKVGEEIQGEFGDQLSALVTSCLNIVFIDDVYEFKVVFETKRNSTSVRFDLTKNGKTQGLMDSSGGGVINIVTIGLRFAMYSMSHDKSRNCLIIDEGFGALRGSDNVKRVYEMLDTISKSLGLQLIMINNANEDLDLTEDYNVITLMNEGGVARVL